jgi:hypothetical protein
MTIIPFASQKAYSIGTNAAGNSKNVSVITFGGVPPVLTIGTNEIVTLGSDSQSAFTIPFNATIENIYMTAGTASNITFPSGLTAYPVVQLYVSPPASNTFVALPGTAVIPRTGFSGYTAANTIRTASVTQVGISITAGTRAFIGGRLQTSGSANPAQNYNFNFTGGLALRPT